MIHLSISAIVAGGAVLLVFLLWYPAPLHTAVGVTGIFLIILGVDVAIGPLLTAIVYRPEKKSLKFDLATIALLQLVAFLYGIWTVAEGRPVWLVYNVDRFDLVQAYQIDSRKAGDAALAYRSAPWFGPQWVAAQAPGNVDERQKILMESLLAGVDIAQHPELYRPLESEADSIREHARPFDELLRYNAESAVQEIRRRWPEGDVFLPMMAKVKPVTVLINKASAEVVAIVALNPWE